MDRLLITCIKPVLQHPSRLAATRAAMAKRWQNDTNRRLEENVALGLVHHPDQGSSIIGKEFVYDLARHLQE